MPTFPTATQAENDAARNGATVVNKTADGSALDPNTPPWLQPAPVNTAVPTISGTVALGQTLTTSNGTWNFANSFAYAWLRDGTPIAGATAKTYTIVAADQTHKLSCRVTATNTKGSTPATSAQTITVP